MKLLRFLKRYSEFLSIPLGLLLLWYSPGLLRLIDPTAAAFDWGVLQIPILAIVFLFVFTGIVWLYIRITFPKGYKLLDDLFQNKNKELTQWQRSKLVLSLFLSLLFALVFLASAIG